MVVNDATIVVHSSLSTSLNAGNVRTETETASASITTTTPSFSFYLNSTSLETYVPVPNVTVGETISLVVNITIPHGMSRW